MSPCAVSPLYSGVTSSSSAAHPAKVATYVGLVAIALGTVCELWQGFSLRLFNHNFLVPLCCTLTLFTDCPPVTTTILVTLYLMATKKRPYRDLRYPTR